jgi:hypothetical protein
VDGKKMRASESKAGSVQFDACDLGKSSLSQQCIGSCVGISQRHLFFVF